MLTTFLENYFRHSAAEPQRNGGIAPLDAFRLADGRPDPVRCAELLVRGPAAGQKLLRQVLVGAGHSDDEARAVSLTMFDEIVGWNLRLTGAETVAVLLAAGGVTTVFVYAGTSELALCDAVDGLEGIQLVNGRGDKESAFMAAGASLLDPSRGAAILHGARGLTNAAGGVADALRNEAGTLLLVGLPSSGSARFLPPHGEADLLSAMSAFSDWTWEAPAVPDDPGRRRHAARRFVAQVRDALAATAEPPHRPAILGVPQDVAEQRWIAVDELIPSAVRIPAVALDERSMESALRDLRHAKRPVLLLDDYALHYPGIRPAVDAFSRAIGGAVLQLRYRRGPMLFERLRQDEVQNFVGWLNQFSPVHSDLLESCDLLVTIEDRNIYERVAGRLPDCRKLAVNTDPAKVLKNEYLDDDDTLLVGNPALVLAELAACLTEDGRPHTATPWFSADARTDAAATPEPATAEVVYGRHAIVHAIAAELATWSRPVLIDDSQMFGGLMSEDYDELPRGLRVFGGHGGFVGGGLAYATGLAVADDSVRVMCTLGDQAFTNSFQGLVAAVQQRARVLFVVCNNGESVSLKKQASASYGAAARTYLSNVEGLSYLSVARSLGVASFHAAMPVGAPQGEIDVAAAALSAVLRKAAAIDGPTLVELALPSDPAAWRGIWLTQGFEQLAAVPV